MSYKIKHEQFGARRRACFSFLSQKLPLEFSLSEDADPFSKSEAETNQSRGSRPLRSRSQRGRFAENDDLVQRRVGERRSVKQLQSSQREQQIVSISQTVEATPETQQGIRAV